MSGMRQPPERRDEVDDIVTAWRRERPDLQVDVMQVLSRVSRLASRHATTRDAAFAAHGLGAFEFDVLAALRRAGRPYQLTPGELSRSTHVTSGTMTHRIARLVERELVTRDNHPSDGRAAIVSLTGTGLALVDAALSDLLVSEERLLIDLPQPDREKLATLLRALLLSVADEQEPTA
ncbi:MAG TPA: MarR family transcriptional regulator [Propionibacteriaceae bacterium]